MTTVHRRTRAGQQGAAILIAMLILTLVATLAAGMVWQQQRGIQLEIAERARTQAAWVLNGALDWARLILREDRPGVDHLGEPWATPLAEARLSTFLAADREAGADDGPEAFLAGRILDAQARYNLRNLATGDKVAPAELAVLQRLCESASVSTEVAERIAKGLVAAAGNAANPDARLAPRTLDDLVWLGVEPADLQRLRPFVDLLPEPSPVNVNTAPREVIAAALEGLDLGTADRLVQMRATQPFETLDAVKQQLPGNFPAIDARRLSVNTRFFIIEGRLRLDDRMLAERSLVKRENRRVTPLQREMQSAVAGGG